MSETLVERLARHYQENENARVEIYAGDVLDVFAAKDAELAALRAENARLREAFGAFIAAHNGVYLIDGMACVRDSVVERARAALEAARGKAEK